MHYVRWTRSIGPHNAEVKLFRHLHLVSNYIEMNIGSLGIFPTRSALVLARLKSGYYQTCWPAHKHTHTHRGDPPALTLPTSLIFHRDEERSACIILSERQQRETSLRYLHSHMHCQRFIVQGFNGALTPLPPSLPPRVSASPLPRTHASTPGIHHSGLLLSLFSPLLSVFPLSAVHLPLLFISRPPPHIRFSPPRFPARLLPLPRPSPA